MYILWFLIAPGQTMTKKSLLEIKLSFIQCNALNNIGDIWFYTFSDMKKSKWGKMEINKRSSWVCFQLTLPEVTCNTTQQ